MATTIFKCSIKIAWWVRYYMYGLCVMHWITGADVNEARVNKWLRRGIKVTAE